MNPGVTGEPQISIVVPVRNESGNIEPLVVEIEAAMRDVGRFEIIYVDDGSSDDTPAQFARLEAGRPWFRSFRHQESCGQSAAIRTGVRFAQGSVIVTLDGDGQNDPVFIPRLLDELQAVGASCGLVQGQRIGRHDSAFKRLQSKVANTIRASILEDGTRDTGCGLKCFPKSVYLELPYFDALHRFMPALVRRDGYAVSLVNVIDRPRMSGVSNYGFLDRLWVGVWDLLGVRWLLGRRKQVPIVTDEGASV